MVLFGIMLTVSSEVLSITTIPPFGIPSPLMGACLGAILRPLGVGMSLCMVFGYLVQGIVIGLLGIVALLCLIPLTKGLK